MDKQWNLNVYYYVEEANLEESMETVKKINACQGQGAGGMNRGNTEDF